MLLIYVDFIRRIRVFIDVGQIDWDKDVVVPVDVTTVT